MCIFSEHVFRPPVLTQACSFPGYVPAKNEQNQMKSDKDVTKIKRVNFFERHSVHMGGFTKSAHLQLPSTHDHYPQIKKSTLLNRSPTQLYRIVPI